MTDAPTLPGLILLAHGSRLPEAKAVVLEVACRVAGLYSGRVEPAFAELCEPDPETAAERLIAAGATRLILLPYFLAPGRHTREDIPKIADRVAARTGIRPETLPLLGEHPDLPRLVAEIVRADGERAGAARNTLGVFHGGEGAAPADPDPQASPAPVSTAGIVVIASEILTGFIADQNGPMILRALRTKGIETVEIRLVRDREDEIQRALRELLARCDLVFTSGGLGPTPDDLTREAVANLFGVEVVTDAPSLERIAARIGKTMNAARARMAMHPAGATVLRNRVGIAIGWRLGRVVALPGPPCEVEAVLGEIVPTLEGPALHTRKIVADVKEGDLAADLVRISHTYSDLFIGSYPYLDERPVTLVVTGRDDDRVTRAVEELDAAIAAAVARLAQSAP